MSHYTLSLTILAIMLILERAGLATEVWVKLRLQNGAYIIIASCSIDCLAIQGSHRRDYSLGKFHRAVLIEGSSLFHVIELAPASLHSCHLLLITGVVVDSDTAD